MSCRRPAIFYTQRNGGRRNARALRELRETAKREGLSEKFVMVNKYSAERIENSVMLQRMADCSKHRWSANKYARQP